MHTLIAWKIEDDQQQLQLLSSLHRHLLHLAGCSQLPQKWHVQIRLLLPPDRDNIYTMQSSTDLPNESLALIPDRKILLRSDGQAMVEEMLCDQMKAYLTQRQTARVEGSVLQLDGLPGQLCVSSDESIVGLSGMDTDGSNCGSDSSNVLIKIGHLAIGSTFKAILLLVKDNEANNITGNQLDLTKLISKQLLALPMTLLTAEKACQPYGSSNLDGDNDGPVRELILINTAVRELQLL